MKKFLSLSITTCLFVGCAPTPSADTNVVLEDGQVTVTTSFYPLTHFTEQVGGTVVEVIQMSAPGADPHTYEPTPQQISQVYESDLFVFNGAGQDEWAERIHEELESNGVSVLIATEIVERMSYEEGYDGHESHDEHEEGDEHHDEEHEEDEHEMHEDEHHDEHDGHDGEEHDHEHGEWDPHVWLDPTKVEEIVLTIAAELAEISPAHAAQFYQNAAAYVVELQTLDQDIQSGLSTCALDAVIVSHDAYRYLAHRYGFHTLEIAGLSPSAEPSPARLAELADIAQQEGINHVFFEAQVSPALSETLAAEIGADTMVLHSIEALTNEERSAGKTYVDLMRQNLENLRIALECS